MPNTPEATIRVLLRSREFPSERSLAEILACAHLDNRVAFAREVKHFVRGIEGESDLPAPEPDPAAVFQLG